MNKKKPTTESVRIKKFILDEARKESREQDRPVRAIIERVLIAKFFPAKAK